MRVHSALCAPASGGVGQTPVLGSCPAVQAERALTLSLGLSVPRLSEGSGFAGESAWTSLSPIPRSLCITGGALLILTQQVWVEQGSCLAESGSSPPLDLCRNLLDFAPSLRFQIPVGTGERNRGCCVSP